MNRKGFTLIELLVVIAIIAILAAILFPVFAQAREQARATVCISNTQQIGLGVQMYLQDYDETFPIFYAYNTQVPGTTTPARAGDPLHQGVELEIYPYEKNREIFKCPDDDGSPFLADPNMGCPGLGSYFACYGSSYRFSHGIFTTIANVSSENNSYYTTTQIDTLASLEYPSNTRLMRDEMMPWFVDPKYGYYPQYYSQWHPRGGGIVFADGHAKFVVSAAQFDDESVCPGGEKSGQVDPNAATDGNSGYPGYPVYYWMCD